MHKVVVRSWKFPGGKTQDWFMINTLQDPETVFDMGADKLPGRRQSNTTYC
jgi:hypothetical protein